MAFSDGLVVFGFLIEEEIWFAEEIRTDLSRGYGIIVA
jgi:hypothetical protein